MGVSRDKEKHLAQVKANSARYVERNRAYVRDIKENNPCVDCGTYFHWFVMDFDHVRGEKVKNVSLLTCKGGSLDKLKEEIAKCDLVCSNCHRLRTWGRQKFQK